ncbi:uncharacterized protein LOC134277277 [Saccostrea cucullata]|uniref:uncharacterized protein LOC134277277 n=1 Tax=Saccostrea cuccullata TaxID=36930 RepID=UPI002ECFF05C
MEDSDESQIISDEDLAKVSELVSKYLFFTMASTCKTEAQKNAILLLEFLYSSRKEGLISRYYGGSTAEGTNLKTSDIDKMIVGPNMCVCYEREDASEIPGYVFLIDNSDSSQGYAKLVLLKGDSDSPTIFENQEKTVSDMLKESQGRKLLSSEEVVSFWIDFLQRSGPKSSKGPPETFRHGPCATSVSTDPKGYMKDEIGCTIEQDFAFGMPFHNLPEEGVEWLNERENYRWPSREIVERIKSLKCHVVSVGEKGSKCYSMEWRTSYLLWERELVWSFNDVQLQAYVLLKLLLKKYINTIAPNFLSSFHMKTVVFWESENTENNCWNARHLISFLRRCLLYLKACIKKKSLLHFIDRRKNLFLSIMNMMNDTEKQVLERILEKIDSINNDIITYTLQCADGLHLLPMWKTSDFRVVGFLRKCMETLHKGYTCDFDQYKFPYKLYHYGHHNVNLEIVVADFSTLKQYQESLKKGDTNLVDVHEDIKNSVTSFINMRVAIIEARQMLLNGKEISEKIVSTLKDNLRIDAVTGELYLATCFLAMHKYEDVSLLLTEILNSNERPISIVYSGFCSICRIIRRSGETLELDTDLRSCTFPQARYMSVIAQDVIFAKEDHPLLPDALKWECLLDKAFWVHPAVYLLYLRFLCCKKEEKERNILNLHNTVNKCNGTLHSFRQYNILGYCYFQMENYEVAFQCYGISFAQTYPNNTPNSAVYMLLIVLFKTFRSRGLIL